MQRFIAWLHALVLVLVYLAGVVAAVFAVAVLGIVLWHAWLTISQLLGGGT